MAGLLDRHRNISLLAGLCLFSFSLFALSARQKNHLTPLEQAALAALSPFQRAMNWGADKAFGAWDGYILLVRVNEENAVLRKRVSRLTMENFRLTEQVLQSKRHEKLEEAAKPELGLFVEAHVVGRDASGFARLVTIDKGAAHGLREKMPVITHMGLVGRIIRVSSKAAKVMLITDVRSAVDAMAQDARDGMVAAGANSAQLTVRYLKAGAKAKAGEKVVSSGLGGVYPKGLMIGLLTEIKNEKDALFAEAQIVPLADLDRLEEVLVIKDFEPWRAEFLETK